MTSEGRIDPFAGRDVGWLLTSRAAAHPDRPALVWRDLAGGRSSWTYRELLAEVDGVAGALASLGVGAGSRVCIHMGNRPEFVFAWFATQRLGAAMVTTNTRSAPAELRWYLERSGAHLVVTDGEGAGSVSRACEGLVLPGGVVVADSVVIEGEASAVGGRPLSSIRAPGAGDLPPVHHRAPAGIQFTSGTTARPKGVVWTQANYLWAGRVSAAHEGLAADDVHLTYLPLFHTNAQAYSIMASLWAGGTILLLPRFSRSRFWSIAVEERATWSSMIPFAIRALWADEVPGHHFRGWGTGVVVRSWEERFGVPITAWWGMTETVTHGIVSEAGWPGLHRSMGRAAPEYELRLRTDDGGTGTGPGEGILEIRGERGLSMAAGYLDDPEADARAWTADGWFDTGDRVKVDADGWFTFVEREKDMLRVGAESVAASEIEAVVLRVEGVAECAVVGAPDPMLDEVPVAFVVPEAPAADGDPGAGDLAERVLAACRQGLADFKVPRSVRLVAHLPRATLEKVAKAELRKVLSEEGHGG